MFGLKHRDERKWKRLSELKESTVLSKKVYEGSFLDVRKDVVKLPDGNKSTREWINHPGAACIIPIMTDGKLALIKQYRYPVKSIMIELPAGKLDAGEDPEECAVRELEEEIGYSAGKLTFVSKIQNPSFKIYSRLFTTPVDDL